MRTVRTVRVTTTSEVNQDNDSLFDIHVDARDVGAHEKLVFRYQRRGKFYVRDFEFLYDLNTGPGNLCPGPDLTEGTFPQFVRYSYRII